MNERPHSPAGPIDRPLPDERAVFERISALLVHDGLPARRQLWVVFIGADDRQLPLIVPVEDLPARPRAELVTGLLHLCDCVLRHAGSPGSVVFTLERLGEGRVGEDDAEWFRALHAAAHAADVRVRGVYLFTRSGLRALTMDDAA